MDKKEIIATLIDVSNELDNREMFVEADALTRIAQEYGGLHPTDVEFNPDNDATEHGMLGEMRFEEDERAMRELRNEESLMDLDERIRSLQTSPAPTEEDIAELERLMAYRYGPDFDESNIKLPQSGKSEDAFKSLLEDAGAVVNAPVDENDPFRDE